MKVFANVILIIPTEINVDDEMGKECDFYIKSKETAKILDDLRRIISEQTAEFLEGLVNIGEFRGFFIDNARVNNVLMKGQ